VAPLHHIRKDCRLCGGRDLVPVLSLTPTPPANAFVTADALDQPQEVYPLDVMFCNACCHVQLSNVVDPKLLFENYVYVSGTSPAFVGHFESYAGDILRTYAPPSGSLVLDIGSNDGTLLGFFKKAGMSVLGVDPARKIARQATEGGIETLPVFFDSALAGKLRRERGPAHVITANNVFAHADDLGEIADGIRTLLADDGVFVFEVSYLADVYEKTLFDTIYHEHLSYHSVLPLERFFAAHGLKLTRAERIDTHGGSLRCHVRLAGANDTGDGTVAERLDEERAMGLDKAETLSRFSTRIDFVKAELTGLLAKLKSGGATIAGYGAPAKATTLMYHFGLDGTVIDFIADDSPWKQGLYSPGLHVPVLPSEAIYDRRPDYLIVLAWNFAEPIMANHRAFSEDGGRFIVPLPNVRMF